MFVAHIYPWLDLYGTERSSFSSKSKPAYVDNFIRAVSAELYTHRLIIDVVSDS